VHCENIKRLGRRFTLTGMSPITIAKVNYVWRITLLDTEQNTSSSLILKVGNPKWRVRKTRTEANVLTYLADHPEIKAPKLVAFDDQSEHSELGMEFILMQELSVRAHMANKKVMLFVLTYNSLRTLVREFLCLLFGTHCLWMSNLMLLSK
jgi:hypothetical protein